MPVDDEATRYREAARLTLQQLDWCVTYLHSIRKASIARVLSKNSAAIAQRLASLEAKRPS
jgi:hypothetical protein